MRITYEQIKPYVEQGYVTERIHPVNNDVHIFNYTMNCQFEKKWDDVTTNCRGLIMNVKTDEILSRPFKKFFNYDEHLSLGLTIPNETPEVLEKMDGSLGILYYVDDVAYIATRGAFESDQALWATRWFYENGFADNKEIIEETKGKTYLFEIIYPENKIVVDYDYSGLVLLSIHDIYSDAETIPDSHRWFRTVDKFEFESVENLKKHNKENAEGYVLYYPSTGTRVKIKFDEYVRLHKIVTGLSERGIWEMMVEHGPQVRTKDVLQGVPDEFHKWMDGVLEALHKQYNSIYMEAHKVVREIAENKLEDRKSQALYITKHCSNPSVAFAMLDDKDYQSVIFKMIRPVGQANEDI